jgi:Nucleoside 2-deoxyribosyltransferase
VKWIYLAGPLFTQAEQAFNLGVHQVLQDEGYQVFLPQLACAGLTQAGEIFATCMHGLTHATLVLAILDGSDADSGSCFEVGYAYACEIPIVGLRTDFRGSGDHLGLNLMLTHSCVHLLLTTLQPAPPPTERMTYIRQGEDLFAPLLGVLRNLEGAQLARKP